MHQLRGQHSRKAISNVIPLIDQLVPHTDTIWIYALSIEKRVDRNWQNLEDILRRHFPGLKAKIEAAVFSRHDHYGDALRQVLRERAGQGAPQLNIQI